MGIHTRLLVTSARIAADLRACGLSEGQTVLLHSSLSRIGWVIGGAQAVIDALLEVLTPAGTLMMPTHTAENTDPANWQNPPVPEAWWPEIRAHTPAFDPLITPTYHMGAIPEMFRRWPGVLRSTHPIGSFAALGPQAEFLLANHDLESMFGEDSPVARLYDLDGLILLLGAGHGNNTSLHLAETRASYPNKRFIQEGTAIQVNGQRQWVNFTMLGWDDEQFTALGADYEAAIGYQPGKVGEAETRLLRQRPLVDWAVGWMETKRA